MITRYVEYDRRIVDIGEGRVALVVQGTWEKLNRPLKWKIEAVGSEKNVWKYIEYHCNDLDMEIGKKLFNKGKRKPLTIYKEAWKRKKTIKQFADEFVIRIYTKPNHYTVLFNKRDLYTFFHEELDTIKLHKVWEHIYPDFLYYEIGYYRNSNHKNAFRVNY